LENKQTNPLLIQSLKRQYFNYFREDFITKDVFGCIETHHGIQALKTEISVCYALLNFGKNNVI